MDDGGSDAVVGRGPGPRHEAGRDELQTDGRHPRQHRQVDERAHRAQVVAWFPVTHQGLFFKFPFAVEKKTYPWWDGDLSQAVDISFVKEEELFGTSTYVFQQVIPPTEVPPTRTVPAAVFGGPALTWRRR